MDEAKQKKAKKKAEGEGGAKAEAKADEGIHISAADFEDLKKRIEAMKREKDEMVSMAQRIQADFDNYRKRNASVRTDGMNDGVRAVMEGLLPVLDNFELAVAASKDAGMDEKWLGGFEMVHRMLLEALVKQGLEPIPAEAGQDFDPNMHEAVLCEPSEGVEPGKVLMAMKKGYRVKDRLVRASMVKISG